MFRTRIRRHPGGSAPALRVGGAVTVVVMALSASACGGTPEAEARPSTLTIAAQTPPLSMDPAKNGGGANEIFTDLAYQGLIHSRADGTYVPSLARSFGYVGEGNRRFTISLRDGVRFSDGTPLDSAAVKAYLEYFVKAAGPFAATAKVIESVATPDASTVDIRLSAPQPDLPLMFSEAGPWGNIVNPKVLASGAAVLGTSTAGAGPYMLDTGSSVQGSSYVYTPNPHYHDPAARHFEKIIVKVIPNTATAFQALRSGQVQFMQGDAPLLGRAAQDGLAVSNPPVGFNGLFLQDRGGKLVPALGDVRVRQAINHALDRAALAKAVGGSAGRPVQQIVASAFTGFAPEVEKRYSFDAAQARALLAEAGYRDGFGFSVTVGGFDPDSVKLAQGIAQQLKAVGITMTIDVKATFPDYARAQESGEYPATVTGWGSSSMYTVASQLVLPTGVVNPFRSQDAQMIKLFDQAARLPADQATATWQKLSAVVSEKAWYAPVLEQRLVFIATKDLKGYTDNLSYPNPILFSYGG